MAGIYIHIPYCKKACHYCDFHFSTQMNTANDLCKAIIQELELKKSLLPTQKIETIYFGGGTPSAIPSELIGQILNKIYQLFTVHPSAEITLEANPDDLQKSKIQEIKHLHINRFSIGIQSFHEEDLQWMNRAHSAIEAKNCVLWAQNAGLENISIDLIYGFPLLSDEKWETNIQEALRLKVPHISCYHLTVEKKTALAYHIKKGKTQAPNDTHAMQQMEYLIQQLEQNGFEHYEISNFALPNRYAKHNTNYWRNQPYIGVGPSAHSYFNGKRTWNIAHNRKYLTSILEENTILEEIEVLSTFDTYNEYLMTGLRTQWGINQNEIKIRFGEKILREFKNQVKIMIQNDWIIQKNEQFVLSSKGKKIADYIASELFLIN